MIPIFDLDNTLYNPTTNELYPDVIHILDYLKSNNIRMFVCSHNCNGKKLLQDHNILHYFEDIACYASNITKIPNMKQLILRNNIDIHDIVFFDDIMDNIRDMRQLGIKSVYVMDPNNGIQIEQVISCLSYPTLV
jgi:FMN phosphatase YigB (HAD superfamily)